MQVKTHILKLINYQKRTNYKILMIVRTIYLKKIKVYKMIIFVIIMIVINLLIIRN